MKARNHTPEWRDHSHWILQKVFLRWHVLGRVTTPDFASCSPSLWPLRVLRTQCSNSCLPAIQDMTQATGEAAKISLQTLLFYSIFSCLPPLLTQSWNKTWKERVFLEFWVRRMTNHQFHLKYWIYKCTERGLSSPPTLAAQTITLMKSQLHGCIILEQITLNLKTKINQTRPLKN